MSWSDKFIQQNKDYYRAIEDYDWVRVTNNLVGLESLFHRVRRNNFIGELRHQIIGLPPHTILDAGCGTGLITQHLPPGSYAIDINPRHVARARRHAPQINTHNGDLEQLPFPDRSMRLVICTEVLEHFPEPARPLRELRRVLAPGGRLIGTVPNRCLIWRLRWLSSTRPHEPYHKYYTEKMLVPLIGEFFQLRLLQRVNYGMNWYFVAEKLF